jgi:Tfp pilus assembly protein PilZ
MNDRRKKSQHCGDATQSNDRRMGERRDSMRLPLQVAVKVDGGAFEDYAGDISIGGVFFEKPLPVSYGEEVVLRFNLPQFDKQLEVRGEVMEITQGGSAIRSGTRVKFVELDLRSELLIARYLDESVQSC